MSLGTGSLSPSEERVLGLVAHGKTNGEIGREMFISEKTVKAHLYHVFRSLGVSSRTEAAYAYWKQRCTCGAIE